MKKMRIVVATGFGLIIGLGTLLSCGTAAQADPFDSGFCPNRDDCPFVTGCIPVTTVLEEPFWATCCKTGSCDPNTEEIEVQKIQCSYQDENGNPCPGHATFTKHQVTNILDQYFSRDCPVCQVA